MKNHSRIAAMTILAIGLLSTSSVNADCGSDATWDIGGVVVSCNALGCDLFGISIGDPVTGFLSADAAAAGPNSTFGAADIIDYEFVAGGISFTPADSTLVSATFSTDVDGEIASGSLVLLGSVDLGPPFGFADLEVAIDAGASTFQIETDFLGLGVVASGTLDFTLSPDTDGDGQPDTCDPDDDNDGIGDIYDRQPFVASNQCDEPNTGDDRTLSGATISGDRTCAAKESVVVDSGTQVTGSEGDLRVISKTVRFGESSVRENGKLEVINADPCPNCDPPPPPTIFVTSAAYDGSMGGLAGADALCQQHAGNAVPQLPGTWVALLSTFPDFNGMNRIADTTYRRTDGVIVANSKSDLFDGNLIAAIDKDENGVTPTDEHLRHVWTGTSSDGIADGIYESCGDWTDTQATGLYGIWDSTASQWIEANAELCFFPHRLYCAVGPAP